MAAAAPAPPPGGAAAAAAAAVPGPQPLAVPAEVFRVINNDIKRLIQQIRSKLGGTQEERNEQIRNIVLSLEDINTQIENVGTMFSDNAIKITKDPRDPLGNYTASRNGTYRNNPDYGAINDFINNSNYHSDATGNVSLTHNAESININSIEDDIANQQTLQTLGDDIALTEENINVVQKRLINCQYLEILYLVKHEELMKTFAFLLTLYDRYQYAIKLLLFILKNLLDHQCPEPGQPGEPRPLNIKLPKVLIKNIKNLLKDQKQVQDIISKMKENLNTSDNTEALRQLQMQMPSSKYLRGTKPDGTQMPAGLDNQVNPNPLP
jgi:hypothetical protein